MSQGGKPCGQWSRCVFLVLAFVAAAGSTSPAAKERLGGGGYELVGGTSEQFTAHVKKEIAKWADVVKRTGAKVD